MYIKKSAVFTKVRHTPIYVHTYMYISFELTEGGKWHKSTTKK